MCRLKAWFEPAAQRASDGVRLLGDLLLHEMSKIAFVEGFVCPGDRRWALGGRPAVEHRGRKAVGAHNGEFAIVEIHNVACVPDERRRIGGDKHLTLAN